MRDIQVNKHTIIIYDDIEQLTAERFSKFNKFMMLSDSIGNSFADIEKVHLSKLYLVASDPVKMKDEINNMRLLIFNVLNEVSPRSLAFACLVHSIDGKQFLDLSDSGIDETRKKVEATGITISDLKKKLHEAREKVKKDLEIYFPKNFDPNPVIRIPAFDSLKNHLLARIEAVLNPSEETFNKLAESEKILGNFVKTNSFTEKENDEVRHEKEFEQACIVLSKFTNKDVKKMSVKEYFTLVEYVNEQNKKKAA